MLSVTIDNIPPAPPAPPVPPAPPAPPEAPAAPAPPASPAPQAARVETTNLFFRHDTLLGICQAVGEDFGFNPNILRIAFGSVLVFAPVAVIGSYLGLGVVVALSRWLAPNRAAAIAIPALSAAHAPLLAQDITAANNQRLAA